jgi:AhpC/TSA antioxidant enzyme
MNYLRKARGQIGTNSKIDDSSVKTDPTVLLNDDEGYTERLAALAAESQLYNVPLIHVDCSFGIICEQRQKIAPLHKIISKERNKLPADVTVVFVIRRPGCGACRDHGRQLSNLVREMHNVNAIGIIKETDVDNEALLNFYEEYFNHPIYKDEKWHIFKKLLGDRKLTTIQLLRTYRKLTKRFKERKIMNRPLGGDIFTQGGVLIFDKSGMIRRIFYEIFTEDLEIEEMKTAIEQARNAL